MARSHLVWAAVLIGLGLLTQFSAAAQHPVAGLPFVALGLACLRWREPALLLAVAVLLALSVLPTGLPRATILGPDPLPRLSGLSGFEVAALALGKLLLVAVAVNQFLVARLLYGTERMSSPDPDLALIPPMVPNRTDGLARWARWLGLAGSAFTIAALLLIPVNPAVVTRALAEIGGSLGALALGLGLGAAFSPTDERRTALVGVGVGLVAYAAAVILLLL